MGYKEVSVKRKFMGRFPHGADLLEEINKFINENKIYSGEISIIGAVTKSIFGYYDSEGKKYIHIEKNEHMEMLSASGNISVNDGKPFPHVHIILADKNGSVFGGHLMEGTKIFAAEFIISDFGDDTFKRTDDISTGLKLWNL